jgi:hypothetical protein
MFCFVTGKFGIPIMERRQATLTAEFCDFLRYLQTKCRNVCWNSPTILPAIILRTEAAQCDTLTKSFSEPLTLVRSCSLIRVPLECTLQMQSAWREPEVRTNYYPRPAEYYIFELLKPLWKTEPPNLEPCNYRGSIPFHYTVAKSQVLLRVYITT